ncbi:YczE/YyaS/YitT family protein [Micromonospora antibiotica]|uniref:Uncharacterized protein n=1 Tax=Micromonospora antibiotica TaxID=2807623 RepID=A0ABS3V8I9_9ACTN|nr:hypothetical protein [Micromonospora antibiotica]MBO4161934.1 hypothetical protein [Micromonospora antibiotica]
MPAAPVRPAVDKAFPYLIGCFFFSLGAYFFIVSHLGTDPLDTFALGLLRHVPGTIGIAQAAVAVTCVSIVAVWTRRRPVLSPMLTFFLCGSAIDGLLILDPVRLAPAPAATLLAAGTACCAYGSALIIMSGFGIRAMDLLAIAMVQRWRWPFWLAKGALELTLLATGWLMGGPAGVGTLCFLIGVDLLIQPLMWLNATVFRVRNLGLPPHPAPAGGGPT